MNIMERMMKWSKMANSGQAWTALNKKAVVCGGGRSPGPPPTFANCKQNYLRSHPSG